MQTYCLGCKKQTKSKGSKAYKLWKIKWLEINQDMLIVWLINQDF